MIVGFVHDRNNPSDFEGYDTVQLTVTDQWVPVTVDLSRYNGDRRFLAIRFWGSYYFYVDDVVVDPIPPLSIVPISSNAITVTTTTQQPSNPAQTPFYIEILPTGLPQGTGRVVRIDTFPSIIDSLTPNTTYDIFARIDSLATTCAPPQTVTMPQLLALPYCEQLDGYGDCYNCRPSEWTYSTSNDDQNYTVNYNNWSLRFYSYYSNTYSVYASLPDIDIEDIRDLSLEMRYRFENAACTAEIGLVRSPGEWSTFVPIDTVGSNEFYIKCNRLGLQNKYASQFFDSNSAALRHQTSLDGLNRFLDGKDIEGSFLKFAAANDAVPTKDEWERSKGYVLTQVKALIARYSPLGDKGFYPIYLTTDKLVTIATEGQ